MMSSFRVDLNEPPKRKALYEPMFAASVAPKRRVRKPFLIAAGILTGLILIAFACGYLYWGSFYNTPQYSLALLIDAAKRDDNAEIAKLVDAGAVVDDFMPQVTGKAIELYGRGLPPQTLAKFAKLAEPLLPAVKERASAELPRVIRERTERFNKVPFFAMVIGAGKYLDIVVKGDTAIVTSKIPEHPLEMKMKRNGNRWQIVGVEDEQLATAIARTIGREIMTIAVNGTQRAADTFGIGNLADLLRQAEELVE